MAIGDGLTIAEGAHALNETATVVLGDFTNKITTRLSTTHCGKQGLAFALETVAVLAISDQRTQPDAASCGQARRRETDARKLRRTV